MHKGGGKDVYTVWINVHLGHSSCATAVGNTEQSVHRCPICDRHWKGKRGDEKYVYLLDSKG